MTIYATYFDSNFLTRGLACLESLVAHSTERPRLLVLALDDACAQALARLWPTLGKGHDLDIMTLDEVEAKYTALQAAKAARSRVEYYFTLTPVLCAEAVARTAPDEYAIYIDADLFFFEDPAIALEAVAGADVGLVEHRFPESEAHCADLYGRFNVGWIAFRSSPDTSACITRWQEQCLAACVDAPEDGVYGDQKYLDEWPSRVSKLTIVDHPGVNLAQWNFARHSLSEHADRQVNVDGEALVFYHFTQLRRRGDSLYEAYFTEHGPFSEIMCARIYSPYLVALDRIDEVIRDSVACQPVGALVRKPLYKRDRWLIFWPWRALRLFFRQRVIFHRGQLLSSWRSLPYA